MSWIASRPSECAPDWVGELVALAMTGKQVAPVRSRKCPRCGIEMEQSGERLECSACGLLGDPLDDPTMKPLHSAPLSFYGKDSHQLNSILNGTDNLPARLSEELRRRIAGTGIPPAAAPEAAAAYTDLVARLPGHPHNLMGTLAGCLLAVASRHGYSARRSEVAKAMGVTVPMVARGLRFLEAAKTEGVTAVDTSGDTTAATVARVFAAIGLAGDPRMTKVVDFVKRVQEINAAPSAVPFTCCVGCCWLILQREQKTRRRVCKAVGMRPATLKKFTTQILARRSHFAEFLTEPKTT